MGVLLFKLGEKEFENRIEGNKFHSFKILKKLGLNYPEGVCLDWGVVKMLPDMDIAEAALVAKRVLSRMGIINQEQYEGLRISNSVRSSPEFSMPGKLLTILDVENTDMSYEDYLMALGEALIKVAASWKSSGAKKFRQESMKRAGKGLDAGISEDSGMGIIIQRMVYGGKNTNSASGVVCSRNPKTGEKELYGKFAVKTPGKDMVSGKVPGEPIEKIKDKFSPEIYDQIFEALSELEKETGKPQEVEFVIEDGVLYFLQSRDMKFSPAGGLKYVECLKNENADERETLELLQGLQERVNERTVFKTKDALNKVSFCFGTDSVPGAMYGRLAFTIEKAREFAAAGERVIIACHQGSSEGIIMEMTDLPQVGLITDYGNDVSHEAVITSLAGIPAIINIQGVEVKPDEGKLIYGKEQLSEGDLVGIDAETMEVFTTEDKEVTEQDGSFLDASFGINIPEFRERFRGKYLDEDGKILFAVSYEEMLMANVRAWENYQELKGQDNEKEEFRSNLEKHFLHQLFMQKASEDGIETAVARQELTRAIDTRAGRYFDELYDGLKSSLLFPKEETTYGALIAGSMMDNSLRFVYSIKRLVEIERKLNKHAEKPFLAADEVSDLERKRDELYSIAVRSSSEMPRYLYKGMNVVRHEVIRNTGNLGNVGIPEVSVGYGSNDTVIITIPRWYMSGKDLENRRRYQWRGQDGNYHAPLPSYSPFNPDWNYISDPKVREEYREQHRTRYNFVSKIASAVGGKMEFGESCAQGHADGWEDLACYCFIHVPRERLDECIELIRKEWDTTLAHPAALFGDETSKLNQIAENLKDELTPEKYGFGECLPYCMVRIFLPGESRYDDLHGAALFPGEVIRDGYGDCNISSYYVMRRLLDTGIKPEDIKVVLVKIPYSMDGHKKQLAHTFVKVRFMGEDHYMGFTPYDRILVGRSGLVKTEDSILKPEWIERELDVDSFTEKLQRRYPLYKISLSESMVKYYYQDGYDKDSSMEVSSLAGSMQGALSNVPIKHIEYKDGSQIFIYAKVQGSIIDGDPKSEKDEDKAEWRAFSFIYRLTRDVVNVDSDKTEDIFWENKGELKVAFHCKVQDINEFKAFLVDKDPGEIFDILMDPARRPVSVKLLVATYKDTGDEILHRIASRNGHALYHLINATTEMKSSGNEHDIFDLIYNSSTVDDSASQAVLSYSKKVEAYRQKKDEAYRSNSIGKDTALTKKLLREILPAEINDDRKYVIRYDTNPEKLTEPQIAIIEQYADFLKRMVSDPDNIKLQPFSSKDKPLMAAPLISVHCTGKDFKGIGHVYVNVPAGNTLQDYIVRITAMMNIAFAASNIPDIPEPSDKGALVEGEMTREELERYKPWINIIREQYKILAGKELYLPNSVNGIINALKMITLDLPKAKPVAPEEKVKYYRMALKTFISA